jgi:hypothetical protein
VQHGPWNIDAHISLLLHETALLNITLQATVEIDATALLRPVLPLPGIINKRFANEE